MGAFLGLLEGLEWVLLYVSREGIYSIILVFVIRGLIEKWQNADLMH